MPQTMHPLIDQMPRQAIYSLASRSGPMERKEEIVKGYTGQPKQELLRIIRTEFPLPEDDKRGGSLSVNILSFLKRARDSLKNSNWTPKEDEKQLIRNLLAQLQKLVEK